MRNNFHEGLPVSRILVQHSYHYSHTGFPMWKCEKLNWRLEKKWEAVEVTVTHLLVLNLSSVTPDRHHCHCTPMFKREERDSSNEIKQRIRGRWN